MFIHKSVWICVPIVLLMGRVAIGQVGIGFPVEEHDEEIKNSDGRKPLYIPAQCPENELLYPGDQKDDWICDCKTGYLYHPKSDGCHAAYRRGPCEPYHYLVLPPAGVIPVCAVNPCRTDGMVFYQTRCHPLGLPNACQSAGMNLGMSNLSVNGTTLLLECQRVQVFNRFGGEDPGACPLGSKRSIRGNCIPTKL